MGTRFSIPFYAGLTPKRKQQVNMVLGGGALATVMLVAMEMIGGPAVKTVSTAELPKTKPVSSLPGGQLDPKDAWIGGAGKDLANLKDVVRQKSDQMDAMRTDMQQTRDRFEAELKGLRERGFISATPQPALTSPPANAMEASPGLAPFVLGQPMLPSGPSSATAAPGAGGAQRPGVSGNTAGNAASNTAGPAPARGPVTFPSQKADRLPAPAASAFASNGPAYPPGLPNAGMNGNGAGGGNGAAQQQPMLPAEMQVPSLMRVSLGGGKTTDGAVPGDEAAKKQGAGATGIAPGPRTITSFLPIGFTRAVLLGGLAAPTGGQAQSNPIPVLLRLVDLAVLPNGYRGQVKDCLMIGEGFGDHSAERAYIRATLLSCVMRDGQVLEVPIKGSVFGEDGMNGMAGRLITKQGAILANALLAGIASGIGSGIAQASQTVTTTSLGTVGSSPSDASGILKQGFGTGVGKALDRAAQYYINLAERTFPVIEIQPGRVIDVVIQQGVALDVALASIGPTGPGTPMRGNALDSDRSALLRTVRGEDEE